MEHAEASSRANSLNLRDVSRPVRTYWRGIVVITGLCVLITLVGTMLQPRVYSATAIGMVTTSGEGDLSTALAGDNLAQSKAVSYESLANTRPVAEAVIADLQLDATPEGLLGNIETFVPAETVEVRITAEGNTPQDAADLANAWVAALARQVQALEGGDTPEVAGQVALQPLSSAAPPRYAASPDRKLNLAIGIVVGLGLGLLYAVARYKMDRRIHSIEQVRNDFGLPVLGAIPLHSRQMGRDAFVEVGPSHSEGEDAFTESLHKLRANLNLASGDCPPRTIVVTSALPDEGKSSITANLAMAIASTGRNVVVVDGDLRQPAIAGLFGLTPKAGLADVLIGQAQAQEVLQSYKKVPNLRVLGAGHSVRNPSKLLAPESVQGLLEILARDALVLVDAPPLLPVADAALLTAAANGAIVVAHAQNTTTDALQQALDTLDQVHGTILGVVLNQVPTTGPHAMAFGYYGQYSSHSMSATSAPSDRGGW